MYQANLPDGVIIPDMLIAHVERGVLDSEARRDAEAWAGTHANATESFKNNWQHFTHENVLLCQKYGANAEAELFAYLEQQIGEAW